MNDWPDPGGWCALTVTTIFVCAVIYAFIDLWLMLP